MLSSIALISVLAITLCGATSEQIPDGEGVDCSPPFWHGKLGDNFPLAGISKKSRPMFRLFVRNVAKKTNFTFVPGGTLNVIVRVNRPKKAGSKRIHGFILSQRVESGDCGIGKFQMKKIKHKTPSMVKSGCTDLELDGNTNLNRTFGIQWVAPKCGCLTMMVQIKANDGMLYMDEVDNPQPVLKYKKLVQRMCARTP